MNKLFIGLLIVAAGAGAFFFFRKKNNSTTTTEIKKEWLVGKWQTGATDSTQPAWRYDFDSTGQVIRSLNDSARADTTHYEWNKKNELVFSEKKNDSTSRVYSVLKLTADTLQVQSKDSVVTLFTRVK